MKIHISGSIKPYYVQSVCLIFFPGEKFPVDETDEDAKAVLYVEEKSSETEAVVCARAKCGEKCGETEKTRAFSDSESRERTINLCAGNAVCSLFSEITGFEPSWGYQTGVRCTKLPMLFMNNGGSFDDAVKMLINDYGVKESKAILAASAAKRELEIIGSLPENSASIYVSIPFCPTRCAYCSFVSYSTPRLLSLIPDYLKRLCVDISRVFELAKETGLNISSVYIGGGTPTILDEKQLDILLSAISSGLEKIRQRPSEFTLEAGRPDTLNSEKLKVAKAYGVNRISVNGQTTNDGVLKAIGRNHTAGDFFRAYEIAAKSGIEHINTDLIAGLPSDTAESFEKSVRDMISLNPDNITVHTFSVKKSSAFRESGADVYSRSGGIASDCVDLAARLLSESSYLPYYMYRQKNMVGSLENTGYSKYGAEGLYNIFIMEEVHSILACGAGSVSKIVGRNESNYDGRSIDRFFAPKYPYEYLVEDNYPSLISQMRALIIKNKQ